jgi:hypothetical protein
LLSIVPATTVAEQELPDYSFSGTVKDYEGNGLQNWYATIENLDRDEVIDAVTDNEGFWETDTDEGSEDWEPGDVIEIKLFDDTTPIREQIVSSTEILKDAVIDKVLDFQQANQANIPSIHWTFSDIQQLHATGRDINFRKTPLIWNGEAQVFKVKFKFTDNINSIHPIPNDGVADVYMRFWLTDDPQADYNDPSNPLVRYPDKDLGPSDWWEFHYDERGEESNWVTWSLSVDVPEGFHKWYCVFDYYCEDVDAFFFHSHGAITWSYQPQWTTTWYDTYP